MASDSGIDSQSSPEMEPPMANLSRTHQYRKVMKPMLERKRRARINKCLDELKDLMVSALQTEGETITKLEKADVLELTVRHLRKLKAQGGLLSGGTGSSVNSVEHYRAGFRLCAGEITKFVTSGMANMDITMSARLLQHLSMCLHSLETFPHTSIASSGPRLQSHATSPPSRSEASVPIYGAMPPEAACRLSSAPTTILPAKVESSRHSQPGTAAPVLQSSSPDRPWSAPATTVVKAEVTVVTAEGEKNAWRPW